MKVGFQTGIPLEIGKDIEIASQSDNVYCIINELVKRQISPIYILHSEDISMNGSTDPIADAYVLERGNGSYCSYHDLVVARKEKIELNSLDGILIRGDDIELNPGLDEIYRYVDKSKVCVPVDYFEMKATKDKLDTAMRFNDLNIPKTYYAQDLESLYDSVDMLFNKGHRYVVLKYRFGFGGKDVTRIDKHSNSAYDEAQAFLKRYNQVMVQEFDHSVSEGDIRAILFDGKYVGAIERKSNVGEWRTNICLGGRSERHEPLDGEIEICEKIAQRFPNIKYMGIDLFKTLRLIEVNGFCGALSEIEDFYGVNISSMLIDDVANHKLNK